MSAARLDRERVIAEIQREFYADLDQRGLEGSVRNLAGAAAAIQDERDSALAVAGRYKTALEELVNTGTVLLLSSRQGQDDWDAFADALLAARVLAGEGETP